MTNSNSRTALQYVLTEILEAKAELDLENRLPMKIRLRPNARWPDLNIANPGKVVDALGRLMMTVQVPVCRTNVWWERTGTTFKVELRPNSQDHSGWSCSCGLKEVVCNHIVYARKLHEQLACRWNHTMDPSASPAAATSVNVKPHCPSCGGPIEFKRLMLYQSLYELVDDSQESAQTEESEVPAEVPFGPEFPGMKRGYFRNNLLKSGATLGESFDAHYSWGLPYPRAGAGGWVSGCVTKKRGVKQFRIIVSSWSVLPGDLQLSQGRSKISSGPLGHTARNRRWNTLQGVQKYILEAIYPDRKK